MKQLRAIDDEQDLEMSIGPLSPRALEVLERSDVLMHGRVNDYFGACVL